MESKRQPVMLADFAAMRFAKDHNITYERKPLTQALLNFSSQLDQEAARAISLAILRYTGEDLEPSSQRSKKSLYRELISGLKQGSKDGKFSPCSLIMSRKTTELDKVHLICGLGILGPHLRDEIFCQICKQIIGNPFQDRREKGWTLLACCLCSFLPSNEFLPYLENFLESGPHKERRFCEDKLRKTRISGNRNEPPCSIEYQAILNRRSSTHPILLPNRRVCQLPLDSTTKGLELRKKIKAVTGIVDLFGFSFRVNFGNRVSRVVCGGEHVMDIVSSCEQIAKECNLQDGCTLQFFKEIFSPWHNPSVDPKATELIYSQIISSIKSRKYKIKEDETLAKVVATHCYVLQGANVSRNKIEDAITDIIPGNFITTAKSKEWWTQIVETVYDKKYRQVEGINRKRALEELVNYAKHSMTEDFSRQFDLVPDHGSNDAGNRLYLSINWKYFRVQSSPQSLPTWNATFPEIRKVSYEKLKGRRVGTVTITTIHAQERKFMSPKAEDIHELLNFFLTGLRKRSKYLLALSDHQPTDNSLGQLKFVKGDLITLKGISNGETLQATGRGYGFCQRSGSSGEFANGMFYIIPTLEIPSASLLDTLRNSAINNVEERKVNEFETLHTPSQSPSNSFSHQEKFAISEPPLASSEIFLDSKKSEGYRSFWLDPQKTNIGNSCQSSLLQQNKSVEVSNQDKNSEMFLDSTKPDSSTPSSLLEQSINDQNVHLFSSNMENIKDEDDLFPGPTSTGNTDLILPNQPPTHCEVVHERALQTVEESTQPLTEAETGEENEHLEKSLECVGDNSKDHTVQHIKDKDFQILGNADSKYFEKSAVYSAVKKSWVPRRLSTISFNDTPSYNAVTTYISQPGGNITSEIKLTDVIFGKPLHNTTFEDNIYLEIIKHIQAEENVTTTERSWQLMWLITGLYPCSENIKGDVICLLRSRTDSNSLASQCYMRLVKMITHGRRTYPPHAAEVQAIQTGMDLINHKVFFPDGSCQSFEVESSTTARHLISVITESIGLKYPNGCGLFFKIGEKVFGAAEEYFFFDFIQHFIEVWRRSEKGDAIAASYQVFFLRKVWINVIPGADRVADCRLHYYQELSKYLRGYHKCSKQDCIPLAALIFRAEFGEDTDFLSEIPDMLNKLVPQDVISEMSVDQWEQALEQALSVKSDCAGDDAKIRFLKELSKWTTFGSAFFHVKAKEPKYIPETLLIAIQRDGLALMIHTRKSVIEKYAFNEIEKWSSGGQSVSVDIKTAKDSKKLVFHTALDYQIDDFLTSYISAYGTENREESTTSDKE